MVASGDSSEIVDVSAQSPSPEGTPAPGKITPPPDEAILEVREVAFRVARGRGVNEDDAADIAQTVAEKFIQQSPLPDNPGAWARVVAGRDVIDLDRRRKTAGASSDTRRAREVELPADGLPGLDGVAAFVLRQHSVSAQGMQRQAMVEIDQLLREHISDKEVKIVRMLAEGASHQQIADELGYKNADTVKATVAKIRGKVVGLNDRLNQFRQHPRVY